MVGCGTLFPAALFHGYAVWRNLKVGGLLKRLFNSVVRHGTLTVIRPDGSALDFGSGPPHVAIRFHDRPALLELALNPDLKLGELYMDGRLTVEDGDMAALLDLLMSNLAQYNPAGVFRLMRRMRRLLRPISQYNHA